MAQYTVKYLRINLSTGRVSEEIVPEQITKDYIGGRGFGVNYLYRELEGGADPLGEKNKLLLLTGVLAGTSAQAVSRWMACTKSPLTGGFARSVGGADFGAWLKFVGYDFIIVEGKAEKPVYIHITRDNCQICDAHELWGKNTRETQELLSSTLGSNTRIACIGPAGENLVKYSAIVTGRRTAGRCGTGTVMGSKNLKAVAISAQRNLQLHDPDTFKQLVKEQIERCNNNKTFVHHKEAGTTETQDRTNELGIFPVKNFRYGRQINWEKIVGKEYLKFRTGNSGCYSCSSRCGKVHYISSGTYANAWSEGPEYETIWVFTGPIDNTNIEATIAADQLCDDQGLDTISTGNTIGFAYELYEKGILSKKDTDGLELNYGNHVEMIQLIKKIAKREGIGDILAEGTRKAASIIGNGADAYAMHVKGLEFPGYEPRGAKSMGFNYATASIGASHCYGYAGQEVFGSPVPRPVQRFSEDGNEEIVIYNQDETAMSETGIACGFARNWGWFKELYGRMLSAATGIKDFEDTDFLWRVGERIINVERLINIREGFKRSDDMLPERILTEPLHTNGADGEGQMVTNINQFLDNYYKARGWTVEGVPGKQKLVELGIEN
jgi:aldehyde:ferredoxin oxidoreductase